MNKADWKAMLDARHKMRDDPSGENIAEYVLAVQQLYGRIPRYRAQIIDLYLGNT